MLKQRILTALVLALILVTTILSGSSFWVEIIFAIVLCAAVFELQALTIKLQLISGITLGLVIGCLFWLVTDSCGIQVNFYQSYLGTLIWTGITLFLIRYRFDGKWSIGSRRLLFLLGLILLWICVNGLVFVQRELDQGGWILLYLLTLVWVADIGAYFSGRKFGRHKLAPGISPGKTWEGAIGGIIANIVWMNIVFLLSDGWGIALWQFLLIGIATSLISVVGDLYESILKREAGVKDSGKLLPGHGGVLDRIDSIIAATPVFVSGLFAAGLG